jgi:hypothetical protein
MFSQGLCFFESLGVLFVGGFEGSTAEVSFDLLSDVVDGVFDLVEFVAVRIDGHVDVKVSGDMIPRFRAVRLQVFFGEFFYFFPYNRGCATYEPCGHSATIHHGG